MSYLEKPQKISKQLRQKVQEFLNDRKNTTLLLDIVKHFESGKDVFACLLAIEMAFTNLLKDRSMYIEIIPLKPNIKTQELQYKEWLISIYEKFFKSAVEYLESNNHRIQLQALSTVMNLLAHEGRFPLENKGNLINYVPLNRLKLILIKILSNKQNNSSIISSYTEYLLYNDILFFTWKLLPNLTAKTKPNEIYILNYLNLLDKLQLNQNNEANYLCGIDGTFFTFDENLLIKHINNIWNCMMQWEHTKQSHKKLLVLLLEKVLPHLEKPLLLTDFLMDSLDIDGSISLLALQGIFTMIQVHNLNYSNIFNKLYSMFEPEIFHTKYKARLFYLADLFLSSTHLPENLVAAFVKRLARLALVTASEDIIIICMFIGNLILRHPGLKCLLNNNSHYVISNDPYIMEESDPLKSNAILSCLWEIQTLQHHVIPNVATAAKFINTPLPTIEWDLSKVLDQTGDELFDKEIKKISKLIILAFDRPDAFKGEKFVQYWNFHSFI